MEPDILKVAGQIAGIGGLTLGILLILFRDIIRQKIFPKLAIPEAFRLLRLMVVLVWSVALLGIGAWIYVKKLEASAPSGPGPMAAPIREYAITGLVQDSDGNGLAGVEIFVIGSDDHTKTDGLGSFNLKTKAAENSIVNVRMARSGFKPRTENVKMPSTGLIITLDSARVVSHGGGEANVTGGGQPAETDNNPGGPTTAPPTPARGTGHIVVRYAGDFFVCSLNLKMRVGQKEFIPIGNVYAVSDVPLGTTEYEITGMIACPGAGFCNAHGTGRIDVQDNSSYNVIWQNTSYAACDVRLVPTP